MNGFYSGYFTGAAGVSIGMFIFQNGIISGADAGGGQYDGTYSNSAESNFIEGIIRFTLPIGHHSIMGKIASTEPIIIDVQIKLPTKINKDEIHLIQTPLGNINAKFNKIKEI